MDSADAFGDTHKNAFGDTHINAFSDTHANAFDVWRGATPDTQNALHTCKRGPWAGSIAHPGEELCTLEDTSSCHRVRNPWSNSSDQNVP